MALENEREKGEKMTSLLNLLNYPPSMLDVNDAVAHKAQSLNTMLRVCFVIFCIIFDGIEKELVSTKIAQLFQII